MSRDIKKLQRLHELTNLALTARQSKLGLLEDHLKRQKAHLSELNHARSRALNGGNEDAALQAGADMNWQRWIGTRKTALNHDIARTEVLIEQERAALARAFGRDLVTARLKQNASDLLARDVED